MKRLFTLIVVAVFLSSADGTILMAAAPGQGLFNRLYGSGGWGSSESECPDGQCPHESGGVHESSGRAEAVSPPSVAVQVNGASGVIAFMYERDTAILTAYHVVEGHSIKNIPVTLADGTKCKAEICLKEDGSYSIDKAADIALIRVKSKNNVRPFCSLAYEQPKVGDSVWTCGYGPNDVYRKIPGKVLKFANDPYKGKGVVGGTMWVSGEGQPGDSGGPIFNTAGRVVGIVSRSSHTEPRAPDETWSTSLERIAALCQDTKFPFPWRKDVERALEEAKQLPVPLPPAPPAGLSAKDQLRITAMEGRIAELEGSLEKAKDIYELGREALENAQTEVGKQFAVDLADLKTKHDATVRAADAATTNASDAADIARAVSGKVEEVAEEVKEEKEGLSFRIKERVDGLPIVQEVKDAREKISKLQAAVGWITNLGLPGIVALILGGLVLVGWDVRRKIKDGDPLAIAVLKEKIESLRDRISDRFHGEDDPVRKGAKQ